MNLTNEKYKNNLIFLFIFFYYFLISIFQASDQHWSSILDQDVKIPYNALLVYSGFDQDYVDHPAFTTFVVLGGVYKILSFFFNGFTIQELLSSNDIDQNMQNLFSIARILNSIFCFLFLYLMFKILNEFRIKRYIILLAVLLIVSFNSIYELLFLIRSEILSVILLLLAFYLLILHIKYKTNLFYCYFSGFLFCLSLLAKIQAVFLMLILLLLLPFFFNYFQIKKSKSENFNQKKYFIFSVYLFSILVIGYFIFEFVFAFNILKEYVAKWRALPHYTDPVLFLIFIVFYTIILKYLSYNKLVDTKKVLNIIFAITFGFIFCVLFFLFMDQIGIIKFAPRNVFFLTNPIHFMSPHSRQIFDISYSGEFNFYEIIKKIKDLFIDNPKMFPNKKFTINIFGILIEIGDFFRLILMFLSSILLTFVILKRKNQLISPIIFISFIGMLALILTFSVRHSFGYNIYIYPLFLIITVLVVHEIKEKKYQILIFLFILLISLSEFYLLRDFYKYKYTRENRIYDMCIISNYKNSLNYKLKMNENSFIPLAEDPKAFTSRFNSKMDENFFIKYCEQMKQKASWKTNFFNIKLK